MVLLDPQWWSGLLMPWRIPLTVSYLIVLALVCLYGGHRYYLTWLYYRHKRRRPRPDRFFQDLPTVTVQLPMYNEKFVARRVIEAACAIDYPTEKLEIQVLDDSTDESADIAAAACARMRSAGHDVKYLHRTDRTGYKAGALDAGLATATGELVLIFDADFLPPPRILRRTVHYFTDASVGMVQTCWDHLNRASSLLTRSQAIFLDGHFIIEHTARNRAGRWFNFNGTAGIWRKNAIRESGGWQHDTLTEDVDLSYRAQLAGWDFIYLKDVRCPAELPPEINAFKSQQHRWTKGSIQSAIKLLPSIWRSPAPLATKIEAFFHLTSPMVYLYVVLLMLLFFPAFFVNMQPFEDGSRSGLFFGVSLFLLATASAGVFYTASQRERRGAVLSTICQVPILMAIGIGISLNNARAVIEALLGRRSAFIRTPKFDASDQTPAWRDNIAAIAAPARFGGILAELTMAGYLSLCIVLALTTDTSLVAIPFLIIFAAGFWYVGLSSLATAMALGAPATKPRPA